MSFVCSRDVAIKVVQGDSTNNSTSIAQATNTSFPSQSLINVRRESRAGAMLLTRGAAQERNEYANESPSLFKRANVCVLLFRGEIKRKHFVFKF